jgi:hypothetical protein
VAKRRPSDWLTAVKSDIETALTILGYVDEIATFIGDLANAESLASWSPGERAVLLERYEHLSRKMGNEEWILDPKAKDLERLHALVRAAVVPLVDGATDLARHAGAIASACGKWAVTANGDKLTTTLAVPRRPVDIVSQLLGHAVLPGVDSWVGFRWRRCALESCRQVFARKHPAQQFHSAECQRETHREDRREYMREFMRARRAEEKAQKKEEK